MNPYVYVLNTPSRYIDPDGGSPLDVLVDAAVVAGFLFSGNLVWERSFLGRARAFRIMTNEHTLIAAYVPMPRPLKDITLWKYDMPSTRSWATSVERDFHKVLADGTHLPAVRSGQAIDFVLRHGNKIKTGLVILGLAVSAYDVYQAYQEDAQQGMGYSHTIETAAGQVAGLGGAILGCQVGGAVGTLIAPGPGSIVGCAAGGIIGGIAGEQAVRQTFAFIGQASWANAPGKDFPIALGRSGFELIEWR